MKKLKGKKRDALIIKILFVLGEEDFKIADEMFGVTKNEVLGFKELLVEFKMTHKEMLKKSDDILKKLKFCGITFNMLKSL
jgi:hypothetical protein